MSDEERATRLPECYCTPGDELRVCKPCARRAIVYARAEGRAQGAAEEREACAAIFDAKLAELDCTKADAISLGWTINEVRFADDANQLIDSAAAIRGRK